MKRMVITVFIITMFIGCKTAKNSKTVRLVIPSKLAGDFKDDYDIRYTINDSVWIQHPNIKYHLLSYDSAGQYFIARNAAGNPSEAGLYSRIDIMNFTGMEPHQWGFCLTDYDAKTFAEAAANKSADRANPKKGCGGYPFSRMKRQ